MDEVWKPVVGFEGRYEVSDQGRVRSLDCMVPCRGKKTRLARGRILRPFISRVGYLIVTFNDHSKRPMHQIVAEAFIGPRPLGAQVCHNNGNKVDNRAANLRYGTPVENAADQIVHGTVRRGSAHGCAKLCEDDVRAIRSRKGTATLAEIGAEFNVHLSTVHLILSGRTWQHV